MKRDTGIIVFLGFLSVIAGYLLSKVSLVGRMGMSLFYREYNFLKSWWKGSLLLFIVLLTLFALHVWIQKKLPLATSNKIFMISVVLAVTGLYVSYDDFRHTISHHLLGERFHIGVYLFWLGWVITGFYFIVHNALVTRLPSDLPENKTHSGKVI